MKNMIKNLFYHFGAALLVAAYWVLLVILGLVAYQLGVVLPIIVLGEMIPAFIGVLLIIDISSLQRHIRHHLCEME